jgi:hypothetical protein
MRAPGRPASRTLPIRLVRGGTVWVQVRRAAARLQLSVPRIYRLIQLERLRAVRVRGLTYVDEASLRVYAIEQRERRGLRRVLGGGGRPAVGAPR